MKAEKLGSLLIAISLFLAFTMFTFSNWNSQLDFIENIRYAVLYEFKKCPPYSYETMYARCEVLFYITLGKGLLLPRLTGLSGVLIRLEVINAEWLERITKYK